MLTSMSLDINTKRPTRKFESQQIQVTVLLMSHMFYLAPLADTALPRKGPAVGQWKNMTNEVLTPEQRKRRRNNIYKWPGSVTVES